MGYIGNTVSQVILGQQRLLPLLQAGQPINLYSSHLLTHWFFVTGKNTVLLAALTRPESIANPGIPGPTRQMHPTPVEVVVTDNHQIRVMSMVDVMARAER
ncbi:MAG: hypothetical protein A3C38_04775 [Planctomycetes bacterium RIFCSPHIGHO2_02_FULL_50_42]|nr:MAG: hypothetical protein A2060_04275 [Planctomycetes bacterium GWA2_50_13]OHB89199.1 MAG: hypothetical protein A3C38_04775 [Planctomycetes bacterium RIFCSPHIGHO2_02_FULL_50_42]OHB91850.1 MAG: hypothetical protein A3E75_05370 [Planctomycetes bacterium RIFCSPHIGHO2_12_FULL_51_37]OHB94772.1 MAG: hypothetical protein A3I59_02430 [Planctomycetes bacterium RIFCSPLOWO2_02_FULL_50_16]OHC05253.1 MAG: hypothetical protein A3G17_04820 [Planctomycetes bacterium RIFCSPLOWO2_12_FULL_50_35]